jgi:competence protein ComEC
MRRTNLIIVGCGGFLVGAYLGRYFDLQYLFLLILVIGTLITQRKRLRRHRYLVVVIAASLLVGNMRGNIQNKQYEYLRSYFETKTTVSVQSLEDAEYNDRKQLEFTANNVVLANGRQVPAQITVSGFGEFSVLRGDTVEVSGKLLPARGSSLARMSFAELSVQSRDNTWYNNLRRAFNKKLRDNLPEPSASFAGGLLIGQRTTIPQSVIDDLRVAGLAHIIAVSGYNLTIIIRFLMRGLKWFSRYQKLLLCMTTLGIFMLITGFSASIVRAGMVSVLSLLAWYHGKVFRPAVLLLFVAAASVLYKPEYVWGDVGWYLSFLAFAGIMIVAPILKVRVFASKKPKFVGSIVIETISVLAMVTPYSMYIFGTLSVLALPANVIVAPLIPLAMALSVVASIVPYQFAILVLPARLLLSGILEVSHVLAVPSFAALDYKINFVEVSGIYIVGIAIVFLMWNRQRLRLKNSFLV